MKLVIDIDEELYNHTQEFDEGCFNQENDTKLFNAIKNGTPIPKGHWIIEVWNNREHHTCSVCQRVVNYEPCYHYCPYCGAEMESD